MNKLKKLGNKITCGVLMMVFTLCGGSASVFASSQFSVSPMNQRIILTPGESYIGSFMVSNPADSTSDFNYKITVRPVYIDNNYNVVSENNGDFNQIVDWTKINNPEGTLAPNEAREITFQVNVPMDAPAGGQYVAINVMSADPIGDDGAVNIQSKYAIMHIVYAEIAGTTIRQGEVQDAHIPSFLFSGNISGISTIKNTGNVHSDGIYKLQVFPLFSDEELYTNEENPEKKIILPDRTLMNTTYWEDTPSVGIFNVIYTAEFEGVTTEVKKMVIVCPIWLLAIIIFAVISIIIYLITKSKTRKKSSR